MIKRTLAYVSCILISFLMSSCCNAGRGEASGQRDLSDNQADMLPKLPMRDDGIVRLSKIRVYPQYLEEYVRYVAKVGEISLRTEPGVLAMYAVADKENPCLITILEIYSSGEAYKSHIASAHFQEYKRETLHMVKTLVLSDQTTLNPANRIVNFIQK